MDRKHLIDVAMGRTKADLILHHAQILNVYSGEVLNGEVWVKGGYIAHVHYHNEVEAQGHALQTIDCEGKFLIPGLIDAHVHIESSMLSPRRFAEIVLPWGTTSVLTDPHEIANVLGVRGVEYMHDSALDLPMRIFIHVPSCVPSVVGLEHAGAEFTTKEIEHLYGLSNVIGLAEVMDYIGIIENEDRMHSILEHAMHKGKFIQGHAPFLEGQMLSAYRLGGPESCHESRSSKEAVDKIRVGLFVDARESSISRNVKDIYAGIKDFRYFDRLTLCTDDREPEDILKEGHMNDVVNKIIEAGMHPIDAIRSATYNTARQIGRDDLGAIAPGCVADFVLTEQLSNIQPEKVFVGGNLVAEAGRLLVPIETKEYAIESENSLKLRKLELDDFKLKLPIENGTLKVNVIHYESHKFSNTTIEVEELQVMDGTLVLDDNLNWVAVFNRHGKDSHAIHLVRNFGIKSGAIASTISHDSHNLTIVYHDPQEAYQAYVQLNAAKGGMCAILKDESQTLALPVAGLMTNRPAMEHIHDVNQMKALMRKMGLVEIENPLLRIVTLALIVIPYVKMSDLGCVDVIHKTFIPLFVD